MMASCQYRQRMPDLELVKLPQELIALTVENRLDVDYVHVPDRVLTSRWLAAVRHHLSRIGDWGQEQQKKGTLLVVVFRGLGMIRRSHEPDAVGTVFAMAARGAKETVNNAHADHPCALCRKHIASLTCVIGNAWRIEEKKAVDNQAR